MEPIGLSYKSMARIRKTTEVSCKDCTKRFLKRADCLNGWSGRCKSCADGLKTRGKRRVFYKNCTTCGKESKWIGESLKCRACLPRPKGETHYKWKVDRETLSTARIQAYDGRYREWMRNVKNRDKWKCRIGNNDCLGRMEAHHILPWSQHPELRYEVNNGITLCHYHHPRKREEEKRLAPIFQEIVLSPSYEMALSK